MLTSNQVINRIDEIIDRAYLSFTYRVIGEEFLTDEQKVQVEALGLIVGQRPLMEILYMAARQRSTPGYKKDQTLNQLMDEISRTGVLPALTDEERYTVSHAKASVSQAIEEAKNAVKSRIKGVVLDANLDHKNELALNAVANVPERQRITEENANNLVAGITVAAVGAAAVKTFRREFTTAMTEIVNSAVADELVRSGQALGTPGGSDPIVYKQIVDDDRTSPECRRLHTYNGSGAKPRLYRLSELQANGTNIGKPRNQWRAVIGPTHPNCRCQLKAASEKMIEEAQKKDKDL